eukprot:917498_1
MCDDGYKYPYICFLCWLLFTLTNAYCEIVGMVFIWLFSVMYNAVMNCIWVQNNLIIIILYLKNITKMGEFGFDDNKLLLFGVVMFIIYDEYSKMYTNDIGH